MEDRLSPLSSDSGLHSLSTSSSSQKIFERPGSRHSINIRPASAKLDEEPSPKRPRKEDARVPASRDSSEESLEVSSDDSRNGKRTLSLGLKLAPFCQPSISSQNSEFCIPSEKNEECVESEEEEECELQTSFETSLPGKEGKKGLTCLWENCEAGKQLYSNINYLYDHVQEDHIKPLLSKGGGEEEELECFWDDCQMSIVRGDWNKKINWLEQHFQFRHARYAQTIKCFFGNCKFRCSSNMKLEEHVKKKHDKSHDVSLEEESVAKEEEIVVEVEDPDEIYSDGPEDPEPNFHEDEYLWPASFEKKLIQMNEIMMSMDYQGEWIPTKRPWKGAKHRKAYGSYACTYVKIPPKPRPTVQITKKMREQVTDDVEATLSLTLEDLFPGWGYKSTPSDPMQVITREIEREKREREKKGLDDIPVLERVSPLPDSFEDSFEDSSPPFLLPAASYCSPDSDDSLPSLERFPSNIEEECSRCLEMILETLS